MSDEFSGCPSQSVLVVTGDGSVSLRDEETGELFHNRAGAYTEAWKNFVEPAHAPARLAKKGTLTVLDVCFGLGYNSWVLLEFLLADAQARGRVSIVAIERERASLNLLPSVLSDERLARVKDFLSLPDRGNRAHVLAARGEFGASGEKAWQWSGSTERLTVELAVHFVDLRSLVPFLQPPVDIVFHDPFSPARAPELWSVDLFSHYYRLVRPAQGLVLTYSSASAVRAGFRETGFTVYKTASVGGKSGGTLATSAVEHTPLALSSPLGEAEEERIGRTASGVPYRDVNLQTSRAEVLRRRASEQELWRQRALLIRK